MTSLLTNIAKSTRTEHLEAEERLSWTPTSLFQPQTPVHHLLPEPLTHNVTQLTGLWRVGWGTRIVSLLENILAEDIKKTYSVHILPIPSCDVHSQKTIPRKETNMHLSKCTRNVQTRATGYRQSPSRPAVCSPSCILVCCDSARSNPLSPTHTHTHAPHVLVAGCLPP